MKRYWLRGGIIGLVVGLIIESAMLVVSFIIYDISDMYRTFAEKFFDFFANILLIAPLSKEGFLSHEILVISGVYTFLVGAIVGWVYSKTGNTY